MKVSDYIAEFLADHGVRNCYGYQGTMIAHLVDSICRNGRLVNHVCCNEQGAAFAAVGEAKATGKPAFAYATSGPGAANLLSGIADAYYDSAPVIFITGQLNTYEYLDIQGIRQHGFQEMDTIAASGSIVKYCEKVTSPEDMRYIMEKAWYMASEGRKGPVLIDLPMDIQRSDIDSETAAGFLCCSSTGRDDPEKAAHHIIGAVSEARRPVLLLGNGARHMGQDDVVPFVEKLGIPVITSMLARDILPPDHRLAFGYIGSGYGHRYANMIANMKTDLIVSLGCSFCRRQTGMATEKFAAQAGIIRVDIDEKELERRVHSDEVSYTADCTEVMRYIAETATDVGGHDGWIDVCRTIKQKLEAFDESCDGRRPNRIIRLISRYAGEAGTVCCDVGQHQPWTAQSYGLRPGQKLLFSGGHGAMGFALPAAIGASCGTGLPAVAICGDGAFQMNIQELQWIVREKMPVTVFVMDNSSLGLIRQQQDDIFDGRYYGAAESGGYTAPDFRKIGAAYGIDSFSCETEAELEQILGELDFSRPNLVDIKLDPGSKAWPKTYFGEQMHDQRPYIPGSLMDELLSL